MPTLNVIMLVGHLTRDPEVRYSPTGTPVATLGLAVNTRVKGQDGQWREDPCFIDVVVFGTQAEACGEYLEKGTPALVEGRLQYRKMFQTCGSATLSWSERTINASEGSDDYPSVALPLLPRDRYCEAWGVT